MVDTAVHVFAVWEPLPTPGSNLLNRKYWCLDCTLIGWRHNIWKTNLTSKWTGIATDGPTPATFCWCKIWRKSMFTSLCVQLAAAGVNHMAKQYCGKFNQNRTIETITKRIRVDQKVKQVCVWPSWWHLYGLWRSRTYTGAPVCCSWPCMKFDCLLYF